MLILLPVLLLFERLYFSIADRFHIIDKPNQRSSHSYITRRGGGIIFPVAWLIFAVYSGTQMPYFTLGLILIAVVSFLDDLSEVAVIPRITSHALALLLAFYEFGIIGNVPILNIGLLLFISIAILNAVNFMDGINGITVLYSLVFWCTVSVFADPAFMNNLSGLNSPYNYIIAALLVFAFYNIRSRARCFAGDVGSVSMAYMMIGVMLCMVFPAGSSALFPSGTGVLGAQAGSIKYLLLLSVYGIDSGLTIIHRMILKENILKGHRKHLYQYLANEMRIPHLRVAVVYATVQLPISIWVLSSDVLWSDALILLGVLASIYIGAKYYILHHVSLKVTEGNIVTDGTLKTPGKNLGVNTQTGTTPVPGFLATQKPESVVFTESKENGQDGDEAVKEVPQAKKPPAFRPVEAS